MKTGQRLCFGIVWTFTLLFLAGCDSDIGKGITCPEVRVEYRGALMDQSMVVIVTNAGARPLFDVSISCQRWDRKFMVSSDLKPGDKVEAGWMELPSGLRRGDVVEIFADGYASPYRATVP
jgi:hypothetical protein